MKTKNESQSPLSLQAEKYDRTGRPVVCSPHVDRFTVENDETNSYAEAESELSLGSRSFLHRVNDQVRKRQKQSSKDATQDSDKHSVTWKCLCLQRCKHLFSWGRITWKILHSIKNTEDLTMKQMFKISEKLISEQSDEIYGVKTINWENSSWKYLSLIGDEEVINLQHTKVYVFSDSVLCVGKVNEHPQANIEWEDRLKFTRRQNLGQK